MVGLLNLWLAKRKKMGRSSIIGISLVLLITVPVFGDFKPSGLLEIHYINVGQGGATLIIGPNGTRISYDFGKVSGNRDIVPYLRDTVRLSPSDGIHYTIVSHVDYDHYMGYRDVVQAGYDVLIANYSSGSPKPLSTSMTENWLKPAKRTSAGEVKPVTVGMRISLGNGAEAIVMAANGVIYGVKEKVSVTDENDRSVVLFVHYGNFRYILDGDLGAGPEECTHHITSQKDVETRVAHALIDQGLMTEQSGVDILHIAHHGSQSSTSAAYYNLMKPKVGLISVGQDQGDFRHPRDNVVDLILLGYSRAPCVKAPPLEALFQTEDGIKGCSKTGCTSFSGCPIGDIKVTTDGKSEFTITGNNRIHKWSRFEACPPNKACPPYNTWHFVLNPN